MFLIGTGGYVAIAIAAVLVVLLIILIVCFASCYNKLVDLRNKVRNGFSQIDVVLKRRFDLIPNLVETVKGYASHEKEIWDQFAAARGSYLNASKNNDVKALAEANNSLSSTLSRLLVVSENYPELKANSNFSSMMAELKESENKIQYARQFYNDVVLKYNNKVEMFPSNIIAKMFNFKVEEFFEIKDESQREAPKVSF